MEDCAVCGEAVINEYKCFHGHEYHKTCLNSSTKKKVCLLCDFAVRLPRNPRKPTKNVRAVQCKGKSKVMASNGQLKRCRNKTHSGLYCHLHSAVAATEEEGADTLQL